MGIIMQRARAIRPSHRRLWPIASVLLYWGCGVDANTPVEDGRASSPVLEAAAGSRAAAAGAAGAAHSAGSPAAEAGLAMPVAAGTGADVDSAGTRAAGSGSTAGTGATGATAGASAQSAGSTAPAPEGDDPCGADAQTVTGSARSGGNGNTNLQTSGEVEFLSVKSTLIVPSEPTPTRGTLFLWPGLQPLRPDQTVGYGVLQPVLTWGTSCAPGSLSTSDGWWISAQHVSAPPGSIRPVCKGGKVMKVEVGDKLDIDMTLNGTTWTQTVTNQRNGESVDYSNDLKGQKQQWLLHQIETPTATQPVDDVIFTDVVAKLSTSQPKACFPNAKGEDDYFSPPRASADGETCCIAKIILRASGVAATSPDTP